MFSPSHCLHLAVTTFLFVHVAFGLGTSCSVPLGAGTSKISDPFWMESIKHQGKSAFNSNPNTYTVFRNVKDYGARGDGVTDDTAAINRAITSQNRCGGGSCRSSTVTPAVVYFPKGTYLVSAPIIPYYYTQMIGDAKTPPTLLASASFDGLAVIDADPYIPGGGGAQYWQNQNNFHRVIRNFVIDLRRVPAQKIQGTALHWQVAQATSLMNIVVHMSTASNTAHRGIYMENGSGGYMGDLVFNGGKYGIYGGNQQFTVKNVTFNNAQTGVYSTWNWGWTYQGVTFNNCQVGFDLLTGGLTTDTQPTGAQAIIDAVVTNTPIFIRNSKASSGSLAGSLVLNNVKLVNVPVAVGVVGGAVVLRGGTTTIASWGQGNVYRGTNPIGTFSQGYIPAPNKDPSLLDPSGRIVSRMHPQYADYAVSQFVSVKDQGAVGDGVTDDTAALRNIFKKYSGCKIIFFDAGTYVVSDTVTIPAGTQMTGEAWTVLAGKGKAFQDQNNPRAMFRVGEVGSEGILEISDIVFTTIGPAAGAIVVEWNVRQPCGVQAGAGMWDTHIRIGGVAGSNLEANKCPSNGSGGYTACYAAYLSLHLTPLSTAYIEGAWVWLSDHDLDLAGERQISIYSGRGILSESQGPVWLIGTACMIFFAMTYLIDTLTETCIQTLCSVAEHHVIYQYNIVNAANHYMGLIQTESPYYQPNPPSPTPFSISLAMKDPAPYSPNPSAWGVSITNSHDILIFGAGLYSFFMNYGQSCLNTRNCQAQLVNVDTGSTGINIYSLSTVATTYEVSVNGVGIIDQSRNVNGFASTVTSWIQESLFLCAVSNLF